MQTTNSTDGGASSARLAEQRAVRYVSRVPPSQPAAFFDLDGTLITVNSGRLWMEREWRVGRIGVRQMIRGLGYLAAYRFGVVHMERAFEEAGGAISGLGEATLRGWTEEWYDESVRQHEAPGAKRVIERHRDEGHVTVLLTSASIWEAEKAIVHFGLDHALGTRFEASHGTLTGRVVAPICYGAGKVTVAERFAEEHGIDLARSWFYTDSITDLPMLERVGEPRVVHPDPRLARVAKRRGYPTLDWRVR